MKQILFSIVLLFLLAPGWSGAVERGEAAVSGQGFYDSSFKAEAWDFTDVSVWARDGGAISMADRGGEAGAGSGAAARQVVHSGVRDWAVTPKGGAIAVVPGELYEIACALRCESCETTGGATAAAATATADHSVGVSVVLYSGNDVKSWTFGGKSARGGTDWQTASSRFIVPSGSTRIQPRIVGVGPGRVSFKNFQLRRVGKIRFPQGDRTATLENESVKLEFAVKDCSLRVLDKRTGRVWISDTRADSLIALADGLERYREEAGTVGGAPIHSPGGSQPNALRVFAFDLVNRLPLVLTFRLKSNLSEFSVSLKEEDAGGEDAGATTVAGGEDSGQKARRSPEKARRSPMSPIAYPYPFRSQAGDRAIWPMNEGISYPVEEIGISRRDYTYGGHGLCMAFWGITEDKAAADGKRSSYMGYFETPDDAAVRLQAIPEADNSETAGSQSAASDQDGKPTLLLGAGPVWDPQRGQFGYERTVCYVFFDGSDGKQGHVSICKRYREYAKQAGLWVPFSEKEKRNPALKDGFDRLLGAANIWYMGGEFKKLDMLNRLRDAGLDRILWSAGGSGEELAAMNAIPQVLTSRYDIYQDIMNPAEEKNLGYMHKDWIPQAWPNDIMLNADGDWIRGWGVRQKDKSKPMIHCGVLCDSKAPQYEREKVAQELKTKPYKARFIDTTTASSWRECYNPAHPLNRTQSKTYKMELLGLLGKQFNLVCGSETGHEASVPYCDFYEGMMSLGPYRVPDSGRDIAQIWDVPPEKLEKFQLGESYRLPLWELVYHDCTVSYWYWGDYNNKLPSLWYKRDVFNALYGVPPMYLFNAEFWKANAEKFAVSYKRAEPVSRLTGGVEMTDHRVISDDRTVQQTWFANGVSVIANFGKNPFTTDDGTVIAPLEFKIKRRD